MTRDIKPLPGSAILLASKSQCGHLLEGLGTALVAWSLSASSVSFEPVRSMAGPRSFSPASVVGTGSFSLFRLALPRPAGHGPWPHHRAPNALRASAGGRDPWGHPSAPVRERESWPYVYYVNISKKDQTAFSYLRSSVRKFTHSLKKIMHDLLRLEMVGGAAVPRWASLWISHSPLTLHYTGLWSCCSLLASGSSIDSRPFQSKSTAQTPGPQTDSTARYGGSWNTITSMSFSSSHKALCWHPQKKASILLNWGGYFFSNHAFPCYYFENVPPQFHFHALPRSL